MGNEAIGGVFPSLDGWLNGRELGSAVTVGVTPAPRRASANQEATISHSPGSTSSDASSAPSRRDQVIGQYAIGSLPSRDKYSWRSL